MEQRYYYKTQDEHGVLSMKHELSQQEIQEQNLVRITFEQFRELTAEPEE